MVKRFTTSSSHDPNITSKVRTILYDGGHGDIVNEIIIDGMRDIEQMSRSGLTDHDNRLKMLEDSERDRLTKTGVIELIRLKAASDTIGWVKWGSRTALAALGTALLAMITWILSLAWKGLHV